MRELCGESCNGLLGGDEVLLCQCAQLGVKSAVGEEFAELGEFGEGVVVGF